MSHSRLAALACLLLAAALQPAHAADDFFTGAAQTPSPITDVFALQAIFLHASDKTDLRVDPPGTPLGGTSLSGTRDLGFRATGNDGMLDLLFRLRERNRISVDFLQLNESGSSTLGHPVVFGSQVFNTGDVLDSALQWRVMGVTWTYAFIQNDRFELGAGLGVHLMDLDIRGDVPARFASYETSKAGALPAPALEAAWRVTRRISLTARGQYLRAAINGTSGSLGDFHADAQYRWLPNLSLGAGYSLMQLHLDSIGHGTPGLVGIRVGGPEVFVRVSF